MQKLDEDHQRFVVIELACFVRPVSIIKALKEQYGIDVNRNVISYYDPTNRQGHRLSPEWEALFWATRTAFLKEQQNIGVANRAVRLRLLDEMLDDKIVQISPTLKLAILEQAAKEVGGLFVQKQQGATPEEVNDYVRERMEKVRQAVETALPKADADRVLASIKERLEGRGG